MKNLLIVGFDFPPVGGVAALRLTTYVRNLPGLGWKPHILTVPTDQAIIPNRDASLADLLPPECVIHRSRLLEPQRHPMYLFATGQTSRQRNPNGPAEGGAKRAWLEGGKARFKRLTAAVVLPDRVVGWIPFAVRKARQVVRDYPIDAILTTSPPVSAHVIGMMVSRKTGLPWVAEFRDPWTQYAFAPDRFVPFNRIEEHLERSVLRRASRIVCTTGAMADGFKALHPDLDGSKFSIIPGFYEEELFRSVQPDPQEAFTLVFAGTLYEEFAPNTLFEGLATAFGKRPAMRARTRCLFVGRQYEGFDALITHWGLDDIVERRGFCSHEEVVSLLLGSHVCYYCLTFPRVVAAKLFEYLRIGNHILAVMDPDHPAARIIREADAGTIIPHGRADMVSGELLRLFDLYASNGGLAASDVKRPEVTQYEGRAQTERLVSLLDGLA